MTNLKIWQVVLIVIAIWLAIAVGTFSVYRLVPGINGPGVFGDSFGVVNSLFSGLAFALLFYSTWLQRKELESQRTELELQREELMLTRKEFAQQNETMKIQRFESTFFNLIRIIGEQKNDKMVDAVISGLTNLEPDSEFKPDALGANDAQLGLDLIDTTIDCIRLIMGLSEDHRAFYIDLLSSNLSFHYKKCIIVLWEKKYDRTSLMTEYEIERFRARH